VYEVFIGGDGDNNNNDSNNNENKEPQGQGVILTYGHKPCKIV
jgi:hypothetical protein